MLPAQIEALFDAPPATYAAEHFELFQRFKDALNEGAARAAEPDPSSPSGWRAAFRIIVIRPASRIRAPK